MNHASSHPVILFDGVCNLCNAAVRFIIKRDPRAQLRFASMQSEAARTLLSSLDPGALGPGLLPDSVVLVEDGRVYTRSTAALRVGGRLRFPWPLFGVFWLVPRSVRDWLYDIVARHRYRWFGKKDVCMVPTPEQRARFLE